MGEGSLRGVERRGKIEPRGGEDVKNEVSRGGGGGGVGMGSFSRYWYFQARWCECSCGVFRIIFPLLGIGF